MRVLRVAAASGKVTSPPAPPTSSAGGGPEPDVRLAERLAPLVRAAFPKTAPFLKSAAVLVPIFRENGAWQILYTQRCDELVEHGGQIAFPGGTAEPGDDGPLTTALREVREELGIPAEAVHPLGLLDRVNTSTGYLITPVVGILSWPLPLALQSGEVCGAFRVPLEWLQIEGKPVWREVPERSGRTAVFFRPYEGRVIWGATGTITCDLLARLAEK
jgi:8-oxo-dGTP pyrophosphatase MutT (NUDIX family)